MNCLEFRRRKLENPADVDQELMTHRAECAGCRAFDSELAVLDDGIRGAFAIPVPDNLSSRVLLSTKLRDRATRRPKMQWFAMAASFVAAAILVTAVLRPAPVTALESSIAEHLGKEEAMAHARTIPLSLAEVRTVLTRVGLDVNDVADAPLQFVHAMNCVIDGELMAHLVVRTAQGEYTLVLMPFEGEASPAGFTAHGWHGRLEHREFGSVAVLADRDDDAAIGQAMAKFAPLITAGNSGNGPS